MHWSKKEARSIPIVTSCVSGRGTGGSCRGGPQRGSKICRHLVVEMNKTLKIESRA